MSDMQDIRKALEEKLVLVSGLTADQIAWENKKFKPVDGQSWIRAKLMPTEAKASAIGAGNAVLHRGLFLADCFVNQNAGPAAADILADLVMDGFAYGTQLTVSGKIINIRHAERAGAFQDDPWYYVPVTVTWYSYVS